MALFLPVSQTLNQPLREEALSRAAVRYTLLCLLAVTVRAGFVSSQGLGLERGPLCPSPVPITGVGRAGLLVHGTQSRLT